MPKKRPLLSFFYIICNRLTVLLVLATFSFFFLSSKLFDLQIVRGHEFYESLNWRQISNIYIPPERGNIYDRFGRPLAVNFSAHSVMVDQSPNITQAELNYVLLNFLSLLEKNNEPFIDNLPITASQPFEFTFAGSFAPSQRARFFNEISINDTQTYTEEGEILEPGFSTSETLARLAINFGIDLLLGEIESTSQSQSQRLAERITYLTNFFETNSDSNSLRYNISPVKARNLISLRTALHSSRYTRFIPVPVALDVSLDTITHIEEDPRAFNTLFVNTDSLRKYPGGHYLSHIVGYIGRIRETDDIEALLEQGYSLTDLIGISGIELAFERELRGKRGEEQIYTNIKGRRLGTVDGSRIDPINGSDIFLTIDKYLQQEAFRILENQLVETIINRMTISRHNETLLTVQQLLASLVAANNINARSIYESEEGTTSFSIRNFVLNSYPYAEVSTIAQRNEFNQIIAGGITAGQISPNQILLVMYEQGIITGNETFANRIATGGTTVARNIVIEKLREGEITPQMTNVDPSTGSLVVVDVHTGEVLASVSYPSFDSNQLVNNFNNEYWLSLISDPTTPLFNRAFMERRPPGSTFKMVTGIAGLEQGVINPHTRITDQVRFTRAGTPYPTSWSSTSLGHLNYAEALARSSNYFFYETSFRLGNSVAGGRSEILAIDRLNMYMKAFGLNDRTGVEIGEAFRSGTNYQISSPGLQTFLNNTQGGQAERWTDGGTVRTAIGQYLNDYTAASMARLTAGIATRGNMVNLRLLDRIVSEDGVYQARTRPFDMGLTISESTWDATHHGMRLVTESSIGTANGLFNRLPFSVGSKTGTAEHDLGGGRLSHTTFTAFAPLHEPQIAIYTIIPFGATGTTPPSPSSLITRDVIVAYFKLNQNEENETEYNNSVFLR